jgi:hypothetical protein
VLLRPTSCEEESLPARLAGITTYGLKSS